MHSNNECMLSFLILPQLQYRDFELCRAEVKQMCAEVAVMVSRLAESRATVKLFVVIGTFADFPFSNETRFTQNFTKKTKTIIYSQLKV